MLAGVAATVISTGGALAVDQFVPKGHSYAPGAERLPPLNSTADRINGQADIYEAEIYRIYRERAIHEAEMYRLENHDMRGGTDLEPRY